MFISPPVITHIQKTNGAATSEIRLTSLENLLTIEDIGKNYIC